MRKHAALKRAGARNHWRGSGPLDISAHHGKCNKGQQQQWGQQYLFVFHGVHAARNKATPCAP